VGEGQRIDSRVPLTPREQSVLRHASLSQPLEKTRDRSVSVRKRSAATLKSAKLGTRNRTHTVAEARRNLLII